MNILVWWNPLTWAGDALGKVVGGAVTAFNTIFYFLSTLIYDLIAKLYNLFNQLITVRILDDEIIGKFSSRIGLILGLIMLFMIVFSVIQMTLDPDKIEKKSGNLILKVILVVMMLGVSNFAFRALYGVQNLIIESNVLTKILLPYDVEIDNFGGVLSAKLFTAFYNLNPDIENLVETDNTVYTCTIKTEQLEKEIENGNYQLGYDCLNKNTEEDGIEIIKFNGLLVLIFGLVAAYFMFGYCVSIGVRMVQLAFLEIISPMAIVSYLSPKKDTMFEKWMKIYFATYIDVFIRIILINFIIFLIAILFESEGNWTFWENTAFKGNESFVMAIMIMALFAFAKKAPDLIKKLFPASDSGIGYGFGGGAGLGMLLGAATAMGVNAIGKGASTIARTTNAIKTGAWSWDKKNGIIDNLKNNKSAMWSVTKAGVGGLLSIPLGGLAGIYRGGKAGYSSKSPLGAISSARKEQARANQEREKRIARGGTIRGSARSWLQENFGIIDGYEMIENERNSYAEIKSEIEGDKDVIHAQNQYEYAHRHFVEKNPDSSIEDFEKTQSGINAIKAIDDAKENVWKKKLGTDKAFQEMVARHNKRFRTTYNVETSYETVNNKRKEINAQYEIAKANKRNK